MSRGARYLWRPVLAQMGTAVEVLNTWTLDMLQDAHEMLDLKAEAERQAIDAARTPKGG